MCLLNLYRYISFFTQWLFFTQGSPFPVGFKSLLSIIMYSYRATVFCHFFGIFLFWGNKEILNLEYRCKTASSSSCFFPLFSVCLLLFIIILAKTGNHHHYQCQVPSKITSFNLSLNSHNSRRRKLHEKVLACIITFHHWVCSDELSFVCKSKRVHVKVQETYVWESRWPSWV